MNPRRSHERRHGRAELTSTPAGGPAGITRSAAQGTLAASNYAFTSVNGTLTVTKATLTVSADASRAYGAATGVHRIGSGFVNGETLATGGVTGVPSLTTTATPSSGVGDYPIVAAQGTLVAANYSFASVSATRRLTACSPHSDREQPGEDGRTDGHVCWNGILGNRFDRRATRSPGTLTSNGAATTASVAGRRIRDRA